MLLAWRPPPPPMKTHSFTLSPPAQPNPTQPNPTPTFTYSCHSAFQLLMHMLPLKELNREGGLCTVSTDKKHCLNIRSTGWPGWARREIRQERAFELAWSVPHCSTSPGAQLLLLVPSLIGVPALNFFLLFSP